MKANTTFNRIVQKIKAFEDAHPAYYCVYRRGEWQYYDTEEEIMEVSMMYNDALIYDKNGWLIQC